MRENSKTRTQLNSLQLRSNSFLRLVCCRRLPHEPHLVATRAPHKRVGAVVDRQVVGGEVDLLPQTCSPDEFFEGLCFADHLLVGDKAAEPSCKDVLLWAVLHSNVRSSVGHVLLVS